MVRLLLPEGRVAAVPAGGLIGRLPTAALRLDHPRISEAHALVSLRAGALWMLSLRGAMEADGVSVTDLRLSPGQSLKLAEGVVLSVVAVDLPGSLLKMVLPEQVFLLQGEVVSVERVEGRLQATARFVEPAAARVWPTGPGWRVQVGSGRVLEVVDGLVLDVEGQPLRFELTQSNALAAPVTERRGQIHATIRLVIRFAVVVVVREGRAPVHLSGLDARVLGELAEYAEPVPWQLVAEVVWRGETHPIRLRQNWDKSLARLRQHLAAAGLREDLVRIDGHGNVGLNLLPGDVVEREG